MKTIDVKAVLIVDGEGNYFIHGTNSEDSTEMFKAMQPIWAFDPSKETVHFIEVTVQVPEFEKSSGWEAKNDDTDAD